MLKSHNNLPAVVVRDGKFRLETKRKPHLNVAVITMPVLRTLCL